MKSTRKIKNKGVSEFKTAYPDYWNKLHSDPSLSPKQKREFIKHLWKFSKGTLESHATSFFDSHKLIGPLVTLIKGEALGVVRAKSAMIRRLCECCGLTRRQALRKLGHWIVLDFRDLQSEIKDILGDEPITLYLIMWSYRNNNDPRDPFFGIVKEDLSCQLGLPSFGKEDHYTFGHVLPAGEKAFMPTAFDGGLYDQWEPGGTTKPHDACRTKYPLGLPEVIHKPNRFENISTRLFEVIK